VGRLVGGSEIGLDLDDPGASPAGLVVADQSPPEQRGSDLERGADEM
jgi:hypothetical protein